MRVLLSPIGSHGDVHPFVGLGMELARRGHDVTIIANPHFQSLIERARLPFLPLGTAEQFREALDNPDIWHPTEGFKLIMGYMMLGMRLQYDLIAQHYEPGKTVVVHSPLGLGARLAHEKLGAPLVTVHLAPSGLRSVVDPVRLPGLSPPRWLPAFVHRSIFWIGDKYFIGPLIEKPINAFRAELGLPAVKRPLAGWWNSPQRIVALFPDWFAPHAADWPAQTRMCSFPLFDERGIVELPPELETYLQAGPPPIIFTPGSAMQHGQAFFQAALEACARLSCRGIFLTMHADHVPADLPATIRHFTYIPFSAVFPRSAAVVHHGGIGTTAQALAAGIPQVIMPMGFDQPDNADRLMRLGVGAPLPPRRFTGQRLAALLRSLLRPEVRGRCRAIAERLTKERPLERTCAWIEQAALV